VISIFTVLVSYNRPDLLWRTVKSYTQTKDAGCQLLIVDNGSDAATRALIGDITDMGMAKFFMLNENRYPGAATNAGWGCAPEGVQFLHRSDNDIEYLPGWAERVRQTFWMKPAWSQVSLRTDEEELFQDAVGGNNVVRREVWDAGVRYSEEPWTSVPWEDGDFNKRLRAEGFGWGRVPSPCIVHIGDKMRPDVDLSDPYYDETYAARGITSLLERARAEKT
jgi:GT2 family glycosyltransferase